MVLEGRLNMSIRLVWLEYNTILKPDYVPKKHIITSRVWYLGNINGFNANKPINPEWYLGIKSTKAISE